MGGAVGETVVGESVGARVGNRVGLGVAGSNPAQEPKVLVSD